MLADRELRLDGQPDHRDHGQTSEEGDNWNPQRSSYAAGARMLLGATRPLTVLTQRQQLIAGHGIELSPSSPLQHGSARPRGRYAEFAARLTVGGRGGRDAIYAHAIYV
jgi:hypothetical protein